MAVAGIERRVDIRISSSSRDFMCGWLYSSHKFTVSNPGSAIVLAHGLGGTKAKELKLDVYADNFNQMGYTCVELILFSMADNIRSIPSVVDGLKPGQRKVLYTCFRRNSQTHHQRRTLLPSYGSVGMQLQQSSSLPALQVV